MQLNALEEGWEMEGGGAGMSVTVGQRGSNPASPPNYVVLFLSSMHADPHSLWGRFSMQSSSSLDAHHQ